MGNEQSQPQPRGPAMVFDPQRLARYKVEEYLLGRKKTIHIRYIRDERKQSTKLELDTQDDSRFLLVWNPLILHYLRVTGL